MGGIIEGLGVWLGSLTAGEVGAGAAVASAAVGAAGALGAFGKPRVAIPPSPLIPQSSVNTQAQAADEAAQRRQAVAGGVESTLGPTGSPEGGYMLNPSNLEGKSLLGM